MNKSIIIIIISVILIVSSFVFGIFLGERTTNQTLTAEAKEINRLIDASLLTSLSFAVRGEIAEIEGRNLIISNEGAVYSVKIEDNANISSINVTLEDGSFVNEKKDISFESIKMGDKVTVSVSGIADEGFQFLGYSVTVVVLPE